MRFEFHISRTRHLALLLMVLTLILAGCKREAKLPREEGPRIRAALAEVEAAIRDRDRQKLDSLLHPEAIEEGLTADSVLSFIYLTPDFKFSGFTNKMIIQRNPYARIDCDVLGTAENLRPITVTMKQDKDKDWRLKAIGPRLDNPLEEESPEEGQLNKSDQ